MPQYSYRARDKDGKLKTGQRSADSIDELNNELLQEGITPLEIRPFTSRQSILDELRSFVQGRSLYLEEMSVFSRQMQILQRAGVPIMVSLTQLARFTRSFKLATALKGTIEYLEKGNSLANSMRHYPKVFTPLMTDIIQIGESSGHLDKSFGQLHKYLQFEYNNAKQIKSAFRYPIFLTISILFAILILNIFVIPPFASFYSKSQISLPWETSLLIGSSYFIVNYGFYFFTSLFILFYALYRYIQSGEGRLAWDKFKIHVPIYGNLLKRIILIRFAQSSSIALSAGLSVTHTLDILPHIINNDYIAKQVVKMKLAVERGVSFTKAITSIELFSPIELQILSVGETNGELSPALDYISEFHAREIEYDLKRINDYLAPILISFVSILILIVALGIYLPIWNMINLVR